MNKLEEIFNDSLFLLGAGASKDAGCKVSQEMIEDLETNITHPHKKQVLDFLLSSLHYHSKWKSMKDNSFKNLSPNIEDLLLLLRRINKREYFLPYPITGSWADKILRIEAIRSPSLFEEVEDDIYKKLEEWISFDKNNLDYLKPISELFENNSDSDILLNIFTLNYDLVFETYFNKPGEYLLNYGFTRSQYVGIPEEESAENIRINYYKLHGSINWMKLNDGTITEQREDIDDSEIHTPQLIQFGHGTKFLSVEPFISLLYEFKKQLEKKRYIFIIGYSFFDSYINNLILEGIQRTSAGTKKIIIINPTEISNKDISAIQKSSYLSDLPEFNITDISSNLIKNLRMTTKDFLNKYFSNNGKTLIELIQEFEKESEDIF